MTSSDKLQVRVQIVLVEHIEDRHHHDQGQHRHQTKREQENTVSTCQNTVSSKLKLKVKDSKYNI